MLTCVECSLRKMFRYWTISLRTTLTTRDIVKLIPSGVSTWTWFDSSTVTFKSWGPQLIGPMLWFQAISGFPWIATPMKRNNYKVTDNAETEMIPFFSNKIWFIMLEKLSNENYLASVCTISSTIYYILLNCYNYIFKFKTGLVFCNIILHNRRLTFWNAVTCWTDLKTALTIIDPEFMEVCVLW